jgi:hypothetical protein
VIAYSRIPTLAELVFFAVIFIPVGIPMHRCWLRFRGELDENGLTLSAVLWFCGFAFFFVLMGFLAWMCGLFNSKR